MKICKVEGCCGKCLRAKGEEEHFGEFRYKSRPLILSKPKANPIAPNNV